MCATASMTVNFMGRSTASLGLTPCGAPSPSASANVKRVTALVISAPPIQSTVSDLSFAWSAGTRKSAAMPIRAPMPVETKKTARHVMAAYSVRLHPSGVSVHVSDADDDRNCAHTPPNTAPRLPPIGAPAEKRAKAVVLRCPGGKDEPRMPSAEGCQGDQRSIVVAEADRATGRRDARSQHRVRRLAWLGRSRSRLRSAQSRMRWTR